MRRKVILFLFFAVACGGEKTGPATPTTDALEADTGVPGHEVVDPGFVGDLSDVHPTYDQGNFKPDVNLGDLGITDTGPVGPDTWQQDLYVPADVLQDPGSGTDISWGTGTCIDIMDCINENMCETQVCVQQCVASGSPEAQQQFAALGQCVVQQCGQFGQNEPGQAAYCVYTQCEAQNKPCTKTGDLGCMGVLTCVQNCGQNQACAQDCVTQGTYDAQVKLLAILACIEKNCPNVDQMCIMQKCMQQVMACQSS